MSPEKASKHIANILHQRMAEFLGRPNSSERRWDIAVMIQRTLSENCNVHPVGSMARVIVDKETGEPVGVETEYLWP